MRQGDNEQKESTLFSLTKNIFALAEFTIIAGGGHVSSFSLPGISQDQTEEKPVGFHLQAPGPQHGFSEIPVLPARRSFDFLFDNCIRRRHGWSFQEYVFSRRLLYVFESEVIFTCSKGMYRESTGVKFAGASPGDRGITPHTMDGYLHAKFNSEYFEGLPALDADELMLAVGEYTSRHLTFEEGRLKAFAGVIAVAGKSAIAREDNSLLLHGHPLHYFETALTWQQKENWILRRPSRQFAPSWSWVSAGTKVYFLDNGEDSTRSRLFQYMRSNRLDIFGTPIDEFLPEFVRHAAGSRPTGGPPWPTVDRPWRTIDETQVPVDKKLTEDVMRS